MRPPLRLTSPANPHVKAVVRLREHRARRATGLFLAEGRREVTRALSAGLELRELYVCPELFPDPLDTGVAAPRRFEVTPALFRKLAYNQNPEGVLGVFVQPAWSPAKLRAHAQACAAGRVPGAWPTDLWLVAVGAAKPGNLGAMARTAEAAGAWGMLVADEVVDAFNPNAVRASTGAVFTLPVLALERAELLAFLAERGVKLLAATLSARLPHHDPDLTGPVALVIGPEDTGLDESWLAGLRAAGAEAIAIPMRGRVVDSLNASVAAAVLLFEAVRQRAGRDKG